MDIIKKKDFLIRVAYALVILAFLYLFIKIGLSWCLPFILGFAIAMLLQKPIHLFAQKTKLGTRLSAILLLAFFYIVIVGLLSLLFVKVSSMIGDVITSFPAFYDNTILPALNTTIDELTKLIAMVSPQTASDFQLSNQKFIEMGLQAIPSLSSSLSFATGLFSSIPSFLVSLLFTIISSFFFAMDYRKLVDFFLLQCNDSQREIILGFKKHGLGTVGKFIKSYGIIMLITFVELSIGLSLIGVENAIAIALLIAIFDILPVLGTGGIMIPWFLLSFINGNVTLGIQLIVIYGIITAIRNVLEPKIVGKQVGIHPIVLLFCMFIGARLLGVLGIFILPIFVIILKNLNDEGILHLFRSKDKSKT